MPWSGPGIKRAMRFEYAATISSVPSAEPPSTTICSTSPWVCVATESSAPAIVAALLKHAVMMLIFK